MPREKTTPRKKPPAAARPVPSSPTPVADQAEREVLRAALRKQLDGERLSKREIEAIKANERRRSEDARAEALSRLPQKELCELLRTDRKVIGYWQDKNMPGRNARSGRFVTYDLFQMLPWLIGYLRSNASQGRLGEIRDSIEAEKLRRTRRENDLAEGSLVDRERTLESMRAICAELVSGLRDIDARASVKLAAAADQAECRRLIEREHKGLMAAVAKRVEEAF